MATNFIYIQSDCATTHQLGLCRPMTLAVYVVVSLLLVHQDCSHAITVSHSSPLVAGSTSESALDMLDVLRVHPDNIFIKCFQTTDKISCYSSC